MMLWLKAFHIIAMVAWFAGLFYLPRLMVYHSEASDVLSIERFKVMEHRLYYYITWPAALLTTVLGIWLLTLTWQFYLKQAWMHAKLFCVILLWIYHLYCGHLLKQFKHAKNKHSSRFYRILNELPTVLLMGIVILVVVKPF